MFQFFDLKFFAVYRKSCIFASGHLTDIFMKRFILIAALAIVVVSCGHTSSTTNKKFSFAGVPVDNDAISFIADLDTAGFDISEYRSLVCSKDDAVFATMEGKYMGRQCTAEISRQVYTEEPRVTSFHATVYCNSIKDMIDIYNNVYSIYRSQLGNIPIIMYDNVSYNDTGAGSSSEAMSVINHRKWNFDSMFRITHCIEIWAEIYRCSFTDAGYDNEEYTVNISYVNYRNINRDRPAKPDRTYIEETNISSAIY